MASSINAFIRPRPRRTVVFVHVLKAGGTSLANMLWNSEPSEVGRYPGPADFGGSTEAERLAEMHRLYLMNPYTNPGLTPARRARIRVACGHIGFTMARFFGDDFAYVGMLRDPVERVISQLRGLQAQIDAPPRHELLGAVGRDAAELRRASDGAARSLADIYHEQDVKEFRYLDNLQTRFFGSTATDVPTVLHDFAEVTEASLRRAMDNLARLDVVGLTERFAESVRRVERRTGRVLGPILHENRRTVDDAVPEALRREIAERNAFDIALYERAAALFEA